MRNNALYADHYNIDMANYEHLKSYIFYFWTYSVYNDSVSINIASQINGYNSHTPITIPTQPWNCSKYQIIHAVLRTLMESV